MNSHGTISSYRSGCRCDACRRANAMYERRRLRNRAMDAFGADTSMLVDASECRAKIRSLMKVGFSMRQICRELDLPRSTMRNVMRCHPRTGRPVKKVNRRFHDKVMHATVKTMYVDYGGRSETPSVYDGIDEIASRTGRSEASIRSSISKGRVVRERVLVA